MNENTYVIAGGNSTLLITDTTNRLKAKIIKKYLSRVEQIGFISQRNNIPYLEMMGDELCVNAVLAYAKLLKNSGIITVSGFRGVIKFSNYKDQTIIEFYLYYRQINDLILFDGIGYLCRNSFSFDKELMKKLCEIFKVPAFGIIQNNNIGIRPFVYVKKTNSLVSETACGSGSIAYNIITGIINVRQPTGEIISVNKNKNCFTISSEVTRI